MFYKLKWSYPTYLQWGWNGKKQICVCLRNWHKFLTIIIYKTRFWGFKLKVNCLVMFMMNKNEINLLADHRFQGSHFIHRYGWYTQRPLRNHRARTILFTTFMTASIIDLPLVKPNWFEFKILIIKKSNRFFSIFSKFYNYWENWDGRTIFWCTIVTFFLKSD